MIIEIQFETKFPDIYINGVGVFHHWWLHIKYAYSVMMVKILDRIVQSLEETDQIKKEANL